jgi:esterase/lipase superfamily enzyme
MQGAGLLRLAVRQMATAAPTPAAAPKVAAANDIVKDVFVAKLKEYGAKHSKNLTARVAQILAERNNIPIATKKA